MNLTTSSTASTPRLSRNVRSEPLSAAATDRLLHLLSTDDTFRERFQADPRQAMQAGGFDEDTLLAFPFGCFIGVELASKSVIAGARGEIQAMLLRGLSQTVPNLDASIECTRHLSARR